MNKAPEHYRPFNIKHAKAGAPYGLVGGAPVTILKWDARYPNRPLLGVYGNNDQAIGWDQFGRGGFGSDNELVMLPLGMCEGKPVFVGDKLIDKTWVAGDPEFTVEAGISYEWMRCTWPRPKPQYPETRITADDICKLGSTLAESNYGECIKLANASIAKALENGDVVLPSMLEKLADAIAEDCDLRMRSSIYTPINLAAIIKRVKEGK